MYDHEFILGHEFAHSTETAMQQYVPVMYNDLGVLYNKVVANGRKWIDADGVPSYAGSNRAEYWATLANIWHSVMRESTDGANNGTWTPCNTREELLRYDPEGFDFFKSIFYNGDPGLWYNGKIGDPVCKVKPGDWEKLGLANENELLKWGCTFPAVMADNPYTGTINPLMKWISWDVPNYFNVGLKKVDENNRNKFDFAGYDFYTPEMMNYNPFLVPPYVTIGDFEGL